MNKLLKKGSMSTRDYIYEQLVEDILQMKLLPGQNLSEKEMSEVFNVSRTPIREAFLRLEKEGLLEIYPQKGSVVSLIDYSLVEEAQFMREQLELAIIKLACDSFPNEELVNLELNLKKQEIYFREKDSKQLFELDEQFHYTFFKGCNKLRVWENIQIMNLHFKRVRVLRLVTDYSWEDIIKDHQEIYQAVAEQNIEQAQAIMHKHLTRVWDDSADLISKYPQYFK